MLSINGLTPAHAAMLRQAAKSELPKVTDDWSDADLQVLGDLVGLKYIDATEARGMRGRRSFHLARITPLGLQALEEYDAEVVRREAERRRDLPRRKIGRWLATNATAIAVGLIVGVGGTIGSQLINEHMGVGSADEAECRRECRDRADDEERARDAPVTGVGEQQPALMEEAGDDDKRSEESTPPP